MSDYRRWRVSGGTYFFTVVTYRRRPLFRLPEARATLRAALAEVNRRWPFRTIAIVLLPDHLHCIWELPRGDSNYSKRWQKIKELCTQSWVNQAAMHDGYSLRRASRSERSYWQRRFWEHTLRDEADLKRCADYVHFNPKKHGLVKRVRDYPWSTFHRFVRAGEYGPNWGGADPCADIDFE